MLLYKVGLSSLCSALLLLRLFVLLSLLVFNILVYLFNSVVFFVLKISLTTFN